MKKITKTETDTSDVTDYIYPWEAEIDTSDNTICHVCGESPAHKRDESRYPPYECGQKMIVPNFKNEAEHAAMFRSIAAMSKACQDKEKK